MTQDATLFLRDRSEVHSTAVALFEWVGQDEAPFPSRKHTAKFVRTCARLFEKCGGHREVHGVISDLARIVAVEFVGYDSNGNPLLSKTPIRHGEDVQTILTQFAFADPCNLGFDRMSKAHWNFNGRMVQGGRILGEGLHGSVFSVIGEPGKFVKTFESEDDCRNEEQSLRRLNEHDPEVPSVPRLCGVSNKKLAILASPVGSPVEELRGRAFAWVVAARFVACLEHVHQTGLCHRDVRPSNMGYIRDTTGDVEVVLFDWALSCDSGSQPKFAGTLHYAAHGVLRCLADLGDPIPAAEHDLESLVHTFWDLTRDLLARPQVTMIETSNRPSNQSAMAILKGWHDEENSHPLLRRLLSLARSRDYDGLIIELESLSGYN